MEKIVPERLKKGDEIRVVAPSRSMCILSDNVIQNAKRRLEEEGFKVSFGKNVLNSMDDDYKCADIKDRVDDLHAAFRDKSVKAILTVIGGYNSNQILDYLDYELIKENPKIICGFSDITALANAIYAKTGLVTYSGPHFSSFGMNEGFEYTLKYFREMLVQDETGECGKDEYCKKIEVEKSQQWSNDSWYKNQENRTFYENEGPSCVNEGVAEGEIVGGNLCTLNLLQGTEYMPNVENKILFIEDDGLAGKTFLKEFDRNLQSLLHLAKGKNIRGIVIGRAEKNCEMTTEKWMKLIKLKNELDNIPVIINANFGHTTPIFTFPIGGYAKIQSYKDKIKIELYN